MELLYVTGNESKVKAAKKVLEPFVTITNIALEIPEIQGNPLSVAVKKALDAYELLKKPLIINDSSLVIPSLNGFPSVYTNYVEKTLGDTGLLKLLEDKEDRKAYYLDYLVYIDEYGYQVFDSKIEGSISDTSLKGDYQPFDKIFIRDHDEYPIGIYQNDNAYLNPTYTAFLKFLKKRKVARGITIIDNKVLLLHRRRQEKDKMLDYYAIPGGGVEEGETPEIACLRELQEETSINCEIEEFLEAEPYDNGVCYYFKTKYLNGEIALGGEEKEHNSPENFYEIALIDIDNLNSINVPGKGLKVIKKVANQYRNNQV